MPHTQSPPTRSHPNQKERTYAQLADYKQLLLRWQWTRVAYKSLANLSTYSGGFVSRVCLIILVSSFAFSLQQILTFFQLCTRLIIKLMFPIFPCITSAPDILPGTHCLFADMFCFHLLLGQAYTNLLTLYSRFTKMIINFAVWYSIWS